MTRNEYMEQLKKYLKRLPKEDYDNAIEYFSEYFDEAGPENEQQVMEELGGPKEAAREQLLNLLQESVGDGKESSGEKESGLPAAGSANSRQSTVNYNTAGRNTATSSSDPAKKKSSPGKDHFPDDPCALCITGQPGAYDQRAGSTVCSSCCDRIRDLFPGRDKYRHHSRWNHDRRFRCNTDPEICGSSLHDGWWWLSHGRSRYPDRSSYHIYL